MPENRQELSLRLALVRQQLSVATDPQSRDILHTMIENMEERLEALDLPGSQGGEHRDGPTNF